MGFRVLSSAQAMDPADDRTRTFQLLSHNNTEDSSLGSIVPEP